MGAANPGSPLSMAASALTLRPAQPSDIGTVMAIERLPNFELYVARSEESEHRDALFALPRLPSGRRRNRRDRGLRHPARPRRRPRQPLSPARRRRPSRTGAWHGVPEPRPRRSVRTNGRRAVLSRLLRRQRPRASRLPQARHEPRRRPAPGLSPQRRDPRRPRHDGSPEGRVGGAAPIYSIDMFVFSWNQPNLAGFPLDGAWLQVGFAWNLSCEISVFNGLRGP